jgi:hypothetical protein
MANALSLHVTIDHAAIRAWAERRGARPSMPVGEGRPWPLLFDLGRPDTGVREIAWERFFDEFERANLAFIYRDTGPNGALDDLHEFISRSAVPELTVSAQSTIVERIV